MDISAITQPLTSQVSVRRTASSWHFPRNIKSKGLTLILLWNMIAGFIYGNITSIPIAFALLERVSIIPFYIILNSTLAAYGIFGLVQMLYPISGLLADVRYGRYTMIKSSLTSIAIGLTFTIGMLISLVSIKGIPPNTVKIVQAVIGVIVFMILIVGFSGFQSNAVQFGLDQLLDASSEELSLFLHWFVWTGQIGKLIPHLLLAWLCCSIVSQEIDSYIGLVVGAFFIVCLIFTLRKRRWFNCENVVSNPYRNVYRVLKFTAKHGKPLGHRSALTYSDDVKPSRIDFAKQKYGGIFTTEVVEDVKTFLQILLMLLAITPTFLSQVSTSYLFPIYGLHLGKNVSVNDKCTYEWMLFESGNLSSVISVVAIPLYIIIVYPHIKRWVPRIIYRMGIGITLKVACVITMFIIQVVANYTASNEYKCLFLAEYRNNKHHYSTQTLEFPTQVLIILNILNGIASPLIDITVLEFISAQGPHTMKGLLLGVFYAFRGLFITLGCVVTVPFAQEKFWGDHRGIFDCGFYYYLSNSVLGVIGLVVFLMAARRYQNRERDDPPYSHQYAEDYYSRYASRRLVEEEVDTYGSIN